LISNAKTVEAERIKSPPEISRNRPNLLFMEKENIKFFALPKEPGK
jgi:hypothetical protein